MTLDPGVAFGLGAAVCWGVGDFLAREALQKGGLLRTIHQVNLIGLVVAVPLMLLLPGGGRISSAALPGLLAIGVVSLGAQVAFYRAFQVGRLSIVSPITSIYPAITVLLALAFLGEDPGSLRLLGAALALVGILLLSLQPRKDFSPGGHPGRGVPAAILSMAAVGIVLFLVKLTLSEAGPVVPLLFIRAFSAGAFGLLALKKGSTLVPSAQDLRRTAPVGLLDTAAFLFFNYGVLLGLVAVVSPLSGLYSAVTVLLAWALLRERTGMIQRVALAPIFTGVLLLSL